LNIPPEVRDIIQLAFFNPATLVVGYWLGRRADEIQKVVIVGFVAGLAGTAFAWLIMQVGLTPMQMKLLSGVFVLSTVLGTAWAMLGHWTRNHRGKGR